MKRRALSHLAAIVRSSLIRIFSLLDTDQYSSTNPEIATAGLNPIWHFAKFGAYENRNGISANQTNWARFPDRLKPLFGSAINHKLSSGPSIMVSSFASMLETKRPQQILSSDFQLTVVIPVFNALVETLRCMESVSTSKTEISYDVVVIDDCSTNKNVSSELQMACEKYGFTFLQNEHNLGFVKTANLGMKLTSNHCVLLNSDTVVSDYWLDAFAMEYQSGVGSIVPLSNNATIYSVPESSTQQISIDQARSMALTAWSLQLNAVDIPTAHGFCMFISRAAIESVGYFDEETFGLGYGEENDFSMRILKAGYKIKLTPKTYVFHEGSASFGSEVGERQLAAQKILEKRWPKYMQSVTEFLSSDQIQKIGAALRLARISQDSLQAVFFSHNLGGGVETAIDADMSVSHAGKTVLIVRPSFVSNSINIEICDDLGRTRLNSRLTGTPVEVGELLSSLSPSEVIVHHELGFSDLASILKCFKQDIEYRFHDYYTICPFINLSNIDGSYCGEPNEADCNSCISSRDKKLNDIESWRIARNQSIMHSSKFTTPSQDTSARLSRYFPQIKFETRANFPIVNNVGTNQETSVYENKEAVDLVILGVLSIHKGLHLVLDLLDVANGELRIKIIGFVPKNLKSDRVKRHMKTGVLSETGEYKSELEALELIEKQSPKAIFFPARWPETYSYTLDIANITQLPIIACDIGAIPSRIRLKEKSLVFSFGANDYELFSQIKSLIAKPGTS